MVKRPGFDGAVDLAEFRESVRQRARAVRAQTFQTATTSRLLRDQALKLRQRLTAKRNLVDRGCSDSHLTEPSISFAAAGESTDPLIDLINLRTAQAEIEEFLDRLDYLRQATTHLKLIAEVELISVLRNLDGEGLDEP